MRPPNELSSPVSRVEGAQIGTPRVVAIHQPQPTTSLGHAANPPTVGGGKSRFGGDDNLPARSVLGEAGDQTSLRIVHPQVSQTLALDLAGAGCRDLTVGGDPIELSLIIVDPEIVPEPRSATGQPADRYHFVDSTRDRVEPQQLAAVVVAHQPDISGSDHNALDVAVDRKARLDLTRDRRDSLQLIRQSGHHPDGVPIDGEGLDPARRQRDHSIDTRQLGDAIEAGVEHRRGSRRSRIGRAITATTANEATAMSQGRARAPGSRNQPWRQPNPLVHLGAESQRIGLDATRRVGSFQFDHVGASSASVGNGDALFRRSNRRFSRDLAR